MAEWNYSAEDFLTPAPYEALYMDYRQFEKYGLTIPNATPKTFATFQKHKQADDEKYKNWQRLYREANREPNTDGY